MKKKPDNLPGKSKGNSPISRQAAYSKAASHFPRALEVIAEALESRSPNVRFGAARLVYETVLPQKFVQELQTEKGESLMIPLIKLNEIRRNNSND